MKSLSNSCQHFKRNRRGGALLNCTFTVLILLSHSRRAKYEYVVQPPVFRGSHLPRFKRSERDVSFYASVINLESAPLIACVGDSGSPSCTEYANSLQSEFSLVPSTKRSEFGSEFCHHLQVDNFSKVSSYFCNLFKVLRNSLFFLYIC